MCFSFSPIRVTAEADRVVVDVAAHSLVLLIHLGFLVFMTTGTEILSEIARQMAFGAIHTVRSSVDREIVVEHRLGPCDVCGKMTGLTGRRESGRSMIRICRRIVIARMTAIAIPREVVALAMANLAIQGTVCSLQRESLIVVEGGAEPAIGRGTVAGFTVS